MSLTPPDTVGKLQMALRAKAKRAPTYRFYAFYDKVYRDDVLSRAYRCCVTKGGSGAWTGRRSPISSRMGWSDGWTNWRKNS